MQAGMDLFGTQICKHSWLLLSSSTCKKTVEITFCSVMAGEKKMLLLTAFYFGLYLLQHAEGISAQQHLGKKIEKRLVTLHYKYNCICIRPESKIILRDKEEIAFSLVSCPHNLMYEMEVECRDGRHS